MNILEQLAVCVKMNWVALLVGETNIGKSSIVRNLASLTGNQLFEMRLTSESDALELLGSFEQVIIEFLQKYDCITMCQFRFVCVLVSLSAFDYFDRCKTF